MAYIHIKGSPYVRGNRNSNDDWRFRKDNLHRERRQIESDLRNTIFSKDKMQMVDCATESEEAKRVEEYDRWKTDKDERGVSNEEKMKRWSEINREFKKHGEEGNVHNVDQIRRNKNISYY